MYFKNGFFVFFSFENVPVAVQPSSNEKHLSEIIVNNPNEFSIAMLNNL